MRDIELMADGLKDYLETNLGTYLTAIETDAADGISLGTPTYELGYKDIFGRNKYPAVLVVLDYVSQEESGAGSAWLLANIDVVVAVTASSPDVLSKKLMRYMDAVYQLIGENESLGGLCLVSSFEGSDFLYGAPGAKDFGVVTISIKLTNDILT
jgi:hypothetical protein